MVKGVEGLDAELESGTFVGGERKALEQSDVPVKEPRPYHGVLARVAPSLIAAAIPWRRGRRKGRRLEPRQLALRSLGPAGDVGSVDRSAAESKDIRTVVVGLQRRAGLSHSNTGDFPSTQRRARKRIAVPEERQLVIVVDVEDMPAVKYT